MTPAGSDSKSDGAGQDAAWSPGAEVKGMSEGAIRSRQADENRRAASQALEDVKSHLAKAADVRNLVKRYPLATVGGAAAVGFIAAALLVPSRSKQAAGRLRTLERVLRDESTRTARAFGETTRDRGSRLMRMGMRLLKPALAAALSSAVSNMAHQAQAQVSPGAEHDDDGEEFPFPPPGRRSAGPSAPPPAPPPDPRPQSGGPVPGPSGDTT